MTLTAAAPYIIEQKYEEYTTEQQEVLSELMGRQLPQVEAFACGEKKQGLKFIGLEKGHLPNLAEITAKLRPRTGWSTTAVSGFLPSSAFFEMLEARKFPVTTYI